MQSFSSSSQARTNVDCDITESAAKWAQEKSNNFFSGFSIISEQETDIAHPLNLKRLLVFRLVERLVNIFLFVFRA